VRQLAGGGLVLTGMLVLRVEGIEVDLDASVVIDLQFGLSKVLLEN